MTPKSRLYELINTDFILNLVVYCVPRVLFSRVITPFGVSGRRLQKELDCLLSPLQVCVV